MDRCQSSRPQLNNDAATTTTLRKVAVSCDAPECLLEPTLKFDKDTIVNNLHKSDQAFAREIVRLISERAEHGIFARDCWGYRFLEPPDEDRPYLKSTGWDTLIGFNAYSYRKRFPVVAELVKEDLKKRGIIVESLNMYTSERGVYCSWALEIPDF